MVPSDEPMETVHILIVCQRCPHPFHPPSPIQPAKGWLGDAAREWWPYLESCAKLATFVANFIR